MIQTATLPTQDEAAFLRWYRKQAETLGLPPDPDSAENQFDYRAAWRARIEPDERGELPEQFLRKPPEQPFFQELEEAAGTQRSPAVPPPAAPQSFFEELEQARPATVPEVVQAVTGGVLRGAVGTLALGVESVGLVASRLTGLDPKTLTMTYAEATRRYAQTIRDVAEWAIPEVEKLKGSFWLSTVPEALGSAAAFAVPGLGLAKLGISTALTTMSMGAMVTAAAQYEDARLHGASEEDQWTAFFLGGLVGSTEALSLGRIFARANRESGGGLERALIHGLLGSAEEGGQEALSTAASNIIAGHFLKYDEDREIGEGIVRDGAAGWVTGLLLGAVLSAKLQAEPELEAEEEVPPPGAPPGAPPAGGAIPTGGEAEVSPVPAAGEAAGPTVLPGMQEGVRPGAGAPSEGGPAGGPAGAAVSEQPGGGGAPGAAPVSEVPPPKGAGVPPGAGGAPAAGPAGAPVVVPGAAEGGAVPVPGAPPAGAEVAPGAQAEGGEVAPPPKPVTWVSELGPLPARALEAKNPVEYWERQLAERRSVRNKFNRKVKPATIRAQEEKIQAAEIQLERAKTWVAGGKPALTFRQEEILNELRDKIIAEGGEAEFPSTVTRGGQTYSVPQIVDQTPYIEPVPGTDRYRYVPPGTKEAAAAAPPPEPAAAAAPVLLKPDKEVLAAARAVHEAHRGERWETTLKQDAHGVFVGQPTNLDRLFTSEPAVIRSMYAAFEPVRELLRKKFGPTITLWRAQGAGAEGTTEGGGKHTLFYASKDQAKHYLERGRQLISRAVPVEDILAVNDPLPSGGYEEFIVMHADVGPSVRVVVEPPRGALKPGRYVHFTTPERAAQLRKEGWKPTGVSPYRGDVLGIGPEPVTVPNWYPPGTLFLSLDPEFWGAPQLRRIGKGKRISDKGLSEAERAKLEADPTVRLTYDYDKQEYVYEVGAFEQVNLEPIEFEVGADAKTYLIDSPAAAELLYARVGSREYDTPEFWEKVRASGIDIVEIRNAATTEHKLFKMFSRDQAMVLSRGVARMVETIPPPGKTEAPKTEAEKRESAWSQLPTPRTLQVGNALTIELANGETLQGHYAVVEADEGIPSHDARRGYAENIAGDINERPYQLPVEGKPFRETVEGVAAAPKPGVMLSDTTTPTDGPPIVTTKAVVLGGNARYMAQQLIYGRGGPIAEFWRKATVDRAAMFGIDASGFKNPVIVRVLADGQQGMPGELSRQLNLPLTTAKGAVTDAVSRGSLLTSRAAIDISDAIAEGTLRDALSDPTRAATILKALLSTGAFSQADITSLVDPVREIPTVQGKQVIEDLLLGSVITDVQILSETPASTRNVILKALPAIVRIKAHFPPVTAIVTHAAQGMTELRSSGQPLADAIRQQVLPGVDMAWKTDRTAVGIMRSMLEETPTQTASRFAKVADQVHDFAVGQRGLFDVEIMDPRTALEAEFTTGAAENAGLIARDENAVADDPTGETQMTDPDEIPTRLQGHPVDPSTGGGVQLGRSPTGDPTQANMVMAKPADVPEGGPVNQPQIMHALSKVIEAAGGKTPIRVGYLGAMKNVLGFFRVMPEVIRVRWANSITTAAHEVGHALEKHVYGWVKGGPWKKLLKGTKGHKDLIRLGKALYPKEPAGGWAREGLAEFIRIYTMEQQDVAKAAPNFLPWFETQFLGGDPRQKAVRAALLEVRRLAEIWRTQGSQERVAESIAPVKGLLGRTIERARAMAKWDVFIRAWFEAGQPLDQVDRQAEKRLGKMLDPEERSFFGFKALRMTHIARAKQMIEEGMIDFNGTRTMGGLNEIKQLVKGRYRDFMVYLYAKRAVALWTDPYPPKEWQRGDLLKGVRHPGVTLEDALQAVKELETPDFQAAAGHLYDWQDGLLTYASQASPVLARVVNFIRNRDPGFYIPLQREFDLVEQDWLDAKKSMGLGAGGSIVQHLRGSGRRIKNPFMSIIANAQRIVLASHRRFVIDTMMKLQQVEGIGNLMVEVPVSKVPVAKMTIEDLLDRIRRKAGIPEGELELTPTGTSEDMDLADLMGEAITFFAPAKFPKGVNPVVPIWDGHEMRWYEMHHNLARLLASMDVVQLPKVVELFFGIPTKVFRLGTTGLRASFGLVTNPIRDYTTLYQNTQSSANAGRLFLEWTKQMGRGFLTAATGGRYKDPFNEAYKNLGLEMSTLTGVDWIAAESTARKFYAGKFDAIRMVRGPFELMVDMMNFPEKAARITEMRLMAPKIGWEPGKPMTTRQMLQMLVIGSEATVDFRAGGNLSRIINRLVPFFGASLQGMRAGVRAARRDPIKWTMRGLQMTAATLALWWYNKDKEWYRQSTARMRALYWQIEVDWFGRKELLLIPRAQEGPMFFSAIPEALAHAWYMQDPTAATEVLGKVFDIATPDVLPVLAAEAKDQMENWDNFWKAPIVPLDEVKGGNRERALREQYGPYTSRLARFLGRTFNLSPRRIDHAIRGIAGGAASDLIDMLGLGYRAVPGAPVIAGGEAADTFILGRLFQRGGPLGYSPRSISDLYDLLEKHEQIAHSVEKKETPDEERTRLFLQDATQAVAAASFIRNVSTDVDQRRELMREAVAIAVDALESVKKGYVPRTTMAATRRRLEEREKILKKQRAREQR